MFGPSKQARQPIGAWITDYNTARPNSELGYKTQAESLKNAIDNSVNALRWGIG